MNSNYPSNNNFGLLPILLLVITEFLSHGPSHSSHNREGLLLFQIEQDTTLAYQYYEKAIQFNESNQFDSAHVYFEKAGRIYKDVLFWDGVVRCYNGMGSNFRTQSDFDQAIHYLNQALEIGLDKLKGDHHEVALSYYNMGMVHLRKNEFDLALEYYQKALDIDLKVLDPSYSDVGSIYLRMGMSYNGKFEYDLALEYMQKALDIWLKVHGTSHRHIATAYTGMGIVYRNKKDYDKALEYAQKSLDIRLNVLSPKHRSVAASYTAVGNIYADKSNYDKALKYFQKALDIELHVYGEIHLFVASDYLRIGIMYRDKHDYDLALEYYQKALDIKLKVLGPSAGQVAKIYDRIGATYGAKGAYKPAMEYLQKALDIKLIVYGTTHPYVADSYSLIGINYKNQGAFEKGLEFLQKALIIRQKDDGVMLFSIASISIEIGRVFQLMGSYEQALANYKKALNIFFEVYGSVHISIADTYRSMGSIYAEKGINEQALNYYQRAITNLVEGFEEMDVNKNPQLNDILHKHELLYALNDKALALEKRYDQSKILDDLRLSVSTYMLNLELIDQIKGGVGSERSKLDFAQEVHQTYVGAIRTGWQLYQSTKEDSLLHQLFQFAEKSKAGIIREALGEMQAKQNAGIPDSLLSLEKNFRVDLAYYDAKIQQFRLQQKEYDSTKVKVFENKFFALNRQYEALIEGFEKNFPKYYQLKYDSRVATVNSIQQALPDQKSILLEYFEGDDSIYIFKITKENIAINAIPKPVDFQQWINDLQKGIGDFSFLQDSVIESYNLYTRSAYKLYELLLKEVLPTNNSEPTQLIIVPDGRLGYIPFETLLYDKVPENLVVNKINYQSLPYLLNRYRINYSYSGSLLLENMHKRSSKADKECLAFAPIYNQGESTIAMRGSLLSLRDTTMTALPGARQEVQALSRFVDGDFRFGSEADERLFKQEASQFQILHLAMHGLTDNQNPSNSRLIFNTVRDSVEDNALYAYELYNMNLNADLVVLSACQTGSGQYAQGEGVMSLARAFMYAGSPSVIQTLWNTEDRASARLMTYFYETLVRGLDKTSALREAKLKYLASANGFEGHPFYWAGFTLYGDVEPISFGNSTTTPLLIILLISFVSIGWFIFKQTKTSLSN